MRGTSQHMSSERPSTYTLVLTQFLNETGVCMSGWMSSFYFTEFRRDVCLSPHTAQSLRREGWVHYDSHVCVCARVCLFMCEKWQGGYWPPRAQFPLNEAQCWQLSQDHHRAPRPALHFQSTCTYGLIMCLTWTTEKRSSFKKKDWLVLCGRSLQSYQNRLQKKKLNVAHFAFIFYFFFQLTIFWYKFISV